MADDNKKKKRKARALLLLFFKELNGKCGSFKDADEWFNFLKLNLDPILADYKDQIPHESLKHLEGAKKLTTTSRDAINKACANLQINVEKVIKMLPKNSLIGNGLIIAVAATSGIVAATVLYLNSSSVDILIKNRGCEPIRPVMAAPIKIPGLRLFRVPIPDGGQDKVSLYPIPVTVDATNTGTIAIGVLGMSMPISADAIGGGAADIVFNGESLMGKKTTINLNSSQSHEVVITCK